MAGKRGKAGSIVAVNNVQDALNQLKTGGKQRGERQDAARIVHGGKDSCEVRDVYSHYIQFGIFPAFVYRFAGRRGGHRGCIPSRVDENYPPEMPALHWQSCKVILK